MDRSGCRQAGARRGRSCVLGCDKSMRRAYGWTVIGRAEDQIGTVTQATGHYRCCSGTAKFHRCQQPTQPSRCTPLHRAIAEETADACHAFGETIANKMLVLPLGMGGCAGTVVSGIHHSSTIKDRRSDMRLRAVSQACGSSTHLGISHDLLGGQKYTPMYLESCLRKSGMHRVVMHCKVACRSNYNVCGFSISV